MIAPWVLLMLGAADPVALHVATAVKVPPARQREVLGALERGLENAGLGVSALQSACDEDLVCVERRAAAQGVRAVVVVTLGPAGNAVAVDLEALRIPGRARAAQATFRVPSPGQDAALARFAAELSQALGPAAPPVDSEPASSTLPAPRPALTPSVAAAPIAARPGPSYAGPISLGVAGAGAAIAAGVLGALGLVDQRWAQSTPDGVRAAHPEAEVRRAVGRANTYYSVAAAAAALAVALVIAAVVWGLAQ